MRYRGDSRSSRTCITARIIGPDAEQTGRKEDRRKEGREIKGEIPRGAATVRRTQDENE